VQNFAKFVMQLFGFFRSDAQLLLILSVHQLENVTVKPRIDRDSFLESHQLKRGQEFNVEVKFTGEPPPKVTWTKGKKVSRACLCWANSATGLNCASRLFLIHLVTILLLKLLL